jgi:hypothetical protein
MRVMDQSIETLGGAPDLQNRFVTRRVGRPGRLAVTVSVLLSQSPQDYHNRYGEPDRERFAARPGISLTVEYGSDHLACYALIDPPQPLFYSEEQVPLMSSPGVSEVLEEVAPVAMRGKQISTRSP